MNPAQQQGFFISDGKNFYSEQPETSVKFALPA
jgi:hypothetical protein